MYLKKALGVALCVVSVAAATVVLTGCAAKTGACAWGDLDTGLILEYRMSEGAVTSYRFTSDFVQTMEIQGQSVPIVSTEILSFSVEPKGAKDGDHALGITIDGLTVTVSSPQGEIEADTENVVGESFDMTLSRLGVEGGLPDPDVLEYTVGPQGPKSVITGFSVIFPDLPEGPITIGDTWPTTVAGLSSQWCCSRYSSQWSSIFFHVPFVSMLNNAAAFSPSTRALCLSSMSRPCILATSFLWSLKG